jgi:hypothetical protein
VSPPELSGFSAVAMRDVIPTNAAGLALEFIDVSASGPTACLPALWTSLSCTLAMRALMAGCKHTAALSTLTIALRTDHRIVVSTAAHAFGHSVSPLLLARKITRGADFGRISAPVGQVLSAQREPDSSHLLALEADRTPLLIKTALEHASDTITTG